jgi:hypothetical protein
MVQIDQFCQLRHCSVVKTRQYAGEKPEKETGQECGFILGLCMSFSPWKTFWWLGLPLTALVRLRFSE